jgi:hypothetical protein
MGYSFYTPILIYGFDENYEKILDNNWLQDNYKYVACYSGDINKSYNINNVIGIVASINEDGIALYNKEELSELLHVKEAFEKYHNKEVKLRYIPAIYGDYQEECTYRLDN